MGDLKFLIILAYYDRPRMVRNALESIRDQDYDNWYLSVIDDGSRNSCLPALEEILGEKLGKCSIMGHNAYTRSTYRVYEKGIYHYIMDSPEDKKEQGGSRHPQWMNNEILDWDGGDEDIVVVLCCDDGLFPSALKNLNEYYKANPEVNHSYSHVAVYDPLVEKPQPEFKDRPFWLNHGKDIDSAYCRVDSSMVTYRKKYFTKHGVRYPSPHYRALDAALYNQLDQFGPCKFNGVVAQYKGSHPSQLSYRVSEEDIYNPKDTDVRD